LWTLVVLEQPLKMKSKLVGLSDSTNSCSCLPENSSPSRSDWLESKEWWRSCKKRKMSQEDISCFQRLTYVFEVFCCQVVPVKREKKSQEISSSSSQLPMKRPDLTVSSLMHFFCMFPFRRYSLNNVKVHEEDRGLFFKSTEQCNDFGLVSWSLSPKIRRSWGVKSADLVLSFIRDSSDSSMMQLKNQTMSFSLKASSSRLH
jgi:hypothetical protein